MQRLHLEMKYENYKSRANKDVAKATNVHIQRKCNLIDFLALYEEIKVIF